MLKQCMELYEILDRPDASAETVAALLAENGVKKCDIIHVQGDEGETGFIRFIVPGKNGKSVGGTAPTLEIDGRLGGLGARPELIGFVSDGDGALCALAAGMKLAKMHEYGDVLEGDVVVCTHICPNAPTTPHEPVRLMGSPVDNAQMIELETELPVDAILSIDTTKGNRIICHRGFAISPTVKEGYILRFSDDLLDIMQRVTGCLPKTLAITTQDITPYGNGIDHINSIMQPSCNTDAPVVGVAITTEVPVAGCATGATHLFDVEMAAKFVVEVAKDFTNGSCVFYNKEEFARLKSLYGDRSQLYRG